MSSGPPIEDFAFDDANIEKFASHGLTERRVRQMLDNRMVIRTNRKGRSAPILLIGTDNGGSCIAVPVAPTHNPTVWRPLTAWPCKGWERALLDARS